MLDTKIRYVFSAFLGIIVATSFLIPAAKADRLASVKKAGVLHCGVVPGVPG